jgi:diadenosine tetraphosphatase ApaH/serine/threonine PP2A family protein phosphatase
MRIPPLIALLSDIHANLQALEACLDDAANQGVSRFVLLGDYVGYGGDPVAVLDRVQDLVEDGALAIKGNHDDMSCDFSRQMNPTAASAANWTREQLSPAQHDFLDSLPMSLREDDRLYVHSEASAPAKWRYVTDCDTARLSLAGDEARIIFGGHVHQPTIYSLGRDDKMTKFKPTDGDVVPLLSSRRWQVVIPSVGQPRDGNPLSGYALFDTKTDDLMIRRVPYDIDAAATQIMTSDLPAGLASRLYRGL